MFEDDAFHHLVQPVCNTIAVLLSHLPWREVGRDEREELLSVPIFEHVDDGIDDVSEVKHLSRLSSNIFNAEHIVFFRSVKEAVILCHRRDFACIQDCEPHLFRVIVDTYPDEIIRCASECEHHRSLAVAWVPA